MTLNYQDAFYHVQEHNPGIDVGEVLDGLKKQDRVKFNDSNQVYTYEVSGRGRVGTVARVRHSLRSLFLVSLC